MDTDNIEHISDALKETWYKQIEEINGRVILEIEKNLIEFDQRYLLISELEEKYPELPAQIWLEGKSILLEEAKRKDNRYLKRWVDYKEMQIVKGKLAQMQENGELTKYTFEELVSLLRPF